MGEKGRQVKEEDQGASDSVPRSSTYHACTVADGCGYQSMLGFNEGRKWSLEREGGCLEEQGTIVDILLQRSQGESLA